MTHFAASWRTAMAWPPTLSVPARSAAALFGPTATLTVPDPVPLEPLVIDIQARSEVAVHAHPDAVVTATEPVPPSAANESEGVESVMPQAGGVGCVGDFSQPSEVTQTTTSRANTVRDMLLT
jgi:hypothetical protein